MLIKEITENLAVQPTPPERLAQRQQEWDDAEAMLKQIDSDGDGVSELTAKGIVDTVDKWMKTHPTIMTALKLLPQTRLVLTVVNAATSIARGDAKGALTAVAGIAGGGLAQNLSTLSKGTDIAQTAAQGNYVDAAKTALDFVPGSDRVAQAIDTGQKLAQGDIRGAVRNTGNPFVAQADDLVNRAEKAYTAGAGLVGDADKLKHAQTLAQTTGLDKKIKISEDIDRIRVLSGLCDQSS
jgi:hypothetical protein